MLSMLFHYMLVILPLVAANKYPNAAYVYPCDDTLCSPVVSIGNGASGECIEVPQGGHSMGISRFSLGATNVRAFLYSGPGCTGNSFSFGIHSGQHWNSDKGNIGTFYSVRADLAQS